MDLIQCIATRTGEPLLFAVTPPRASMSAAQAREAADLTVARLMPLGLDGLIVYDIDDEAGRTGRDRPFPFLPTMDPTEYVERYLTSWPTPVVVYRATPKYAEGHLRDWVGSQDVHDRLSVFVGAPSRSTELGTPLRRAYEIRAEANPALLVGAVAIPERHARRGDEQLRMIAKQEAGCSFFVTQIVYDVNAAKDLVSDYADACDEKGIAPVTVVLTASVCGSMRTLEFLRWLGVDVPRWVENDLRRARDTLDASVVQAHAIVAELAPFCRRLGVPFGVSIESVSIRRAEIEASVRLAEQVAGVLAR